ncbi:MAG: hypothetical protein L0221_07740, partial [Chloroflexi bacterium]|nr:hypothetical protein [Chloroflexota bacterium]
MTDQSTNDQAATPPPSAEPAPAPSPAQTFEQRMEDFGRRAEAAGERWSKDPSIVGAADTATRAWGLIVLAVGIWFFADVTLGYDMPASAWRDVW